MGTHDKRLWYFRGKTFHIVTSFLGFNVNYKNLGPPELFETMLFEDGSGIILDRYSTLYAAKKGHGRHVNKYETSA